MKITPYIRNTILALPLYLLSILPFWLLLPDHFNTDIRISYVLLGALGWWIAFLLRLPIIAIVQVLKLPQASAQHIIVSVSGPAEEITRLVLLLILGLTTQNALSVGLGWAAIEIVYAISQSFGMGILEQKNDTKAREAKKIIKQQGMSKSMTPSAPFWGAIERLSANALHVSFSLLLVTSPLFVILTVPAHSAFNFLALALYKKSVLLTQSTLALVAAAFMLLALIVL